MKDFFAFVVFSPKSPRDSWTSQSLLKIPAADISDATRKLNTHFETGPHKLVSFRMYNGTNEIVKDFLSAPSI